VILPDKDKGSTVLWGIDSLKQGAGSVILFMVGYRSARGLYTLLTDPDLVRHNLLGNLCKGHVASLCDHTSVVWYGSLQTPHG
jgi:hypothetical protein